MSQRINLNTTPNQFMPILYFSQGDIGRTFEIALTSSDGYSIPIGATVEMVATKPSGFGFTVSGSLTNNVATFVTTETMTSEWGRFPAEIVIKNNGDVIGTANFYLNGERNPHPEGTIDGDASTIIPQLTLLVERVETAASSVLDRQTVTQTLPAGSQASYSFDEGTNTQTFGIPQGEAGAGAVDVTASAYSSSKTYVVGDYVIHNGYLYRCTTAITTAEAWTSGHWTQVVLADDVSDLKSDIDYLDNVVLETKPIEREYVTGRYLVNGFGSQTSYARNSKVYPKGKYKISSYTLGHVVVGYVSDSSGVGISGDWFTGAYEFETTYDFYITFSKGSAFTTADLEAIEENFVVTKILDTDGSSMESKLSTVLSNYSVVTDFLSEVYIINGNNDNNVRKASFSSGVGQLAIGDSSDWCCYREFTAEAPMEVGKVYEISSYGGSGVTAYVVPKALNASFSNAGTLYAFSDAAYELWKMPTIEEHFVNMLNDIDSLCGTSTQSIVFLGDSIFGLERGSTSIPLLVGDYTGAKTYNCALGGTEGNSHGDAKWSNYDFTKLSQAIASEDYTDQTSHLSDDGIPSYFSGVITQLSALDFSKVDLVCLTYGGNDYQNSHSDVDTFVSAMCANINRLLTAYPNLRFMLMNPPYKMFLDSGTHEYVTDGDLWQNSFGETLKDYAESFKTISQTVHAPYIDAYNELGINKNNSSQWFTTNDGSHPSEQGRKETAKLVAEYIKRMLYD